MKHFEYTRDLDGAPAGTVRALSPDDVAPLIASGALVETDKPVTEATATAEPDAEPQAPITSVDVAPAKPAATRAPRAPKSN